MTPYQIKVAWLYLMIGSFSTTYRGYFHRLVSPVRLATLPYRVQPFHSGKLWRGFCAQRHTSVGIAHEYLAGSNADRIRSNPGASIKSANTGTANRYASEFQCIGK